MQKTARGMRKWKSVRMAAVFWENVMGSCAISLWKVGANIAAVWDGCQGGGGVSMGAEPR